MTFWLDCHVLFQSVLSYSGDKYRKELNKFYRAIKFYYY